MELGQRIARVLDGAGCVGHGVAAADPFPEARVALEEAVGSGRSAGLAFTFRHPELATHPGRSFPRARSLVVAAHAYVPASGDPGPPRPLTARIARFATSDHYAPLRSALGAVADLLRGAGHRAEVLVDDNRLVDRAAAMRAGVGWFGKSTMVLVPGSGPWVLLGSVVTDAVLPPTAPMRRTCGTCTACIPACPTGAIVAPGVLDARRCLAAVLQSPGWIPRELRRAVGDRLYGCDDCLDACPPGDRLRLGAASGGRVDLIPLLRLTDDALRARFPHFFVPRQDGRWLRRNALVVLGNSGGRDALPVLADHADRPDPMIRGHAAWALGEIGGEVAAGLLGRMAAADPDPAVREEAALAGGGTLP